MDKTTRYLLLILVIIIFFALAPLIILYVSGKGFNLADLNRGTGILDIQSDPNQATVFLNNIQTDTTPATIRFIKEGFYDIELKKEGWWNWHKRLYIESGKASYAGTINEAVKLLPKTQSIASDITQSDSFVIRNNSIFAIEKNDSLVEYDIDDNKRLTTTQLPVPIQNLRSSGNNNYFIAKTNTDNFVLIDVPEKKLIPLPRYFQNASEIQVTSSEMIIAVSGSSLVVSNIDTLQVLPILENVLTFTIDNNTIYVARNNPSQSIETYLWDGQTLALQSVLLDQPLPKSENYQLLLTNQKELFLKAGQALYRVNSQLDLLNSQITEVYLDKAHQLLTFETPSEIYYYNFLSAKAELLTRNSENILTSIVIPNLGYGFSGTNSGMQAIEIDNRNGQNHYQLIERQPVDDMFLSPKEDKIIFLSNKVIYLLPITK